MDQTPTFEVQVPQTSAEPEPSEAVTKRKTRRVASSHPNYLYANYFSAFTKKIVVGFNISFDVKVCLLTEKSTNFIELSSFAFSNLFLKADQILLDLLKAQRIVYELEENKVLKLTTNFKNETTAIFEDTFRQVKIAFTEQELREIIRIRNCLSYIIQNLCFNKAAVAQYYQAYVNYCVCNNVDSLEIHHLNFAQVEFGFFNIDLPRLFLEIPLTLKSKLQKDIYFAGLLSATLN